VSDQGRWAGRVARAADSDHRAGLRAGRCDRPAISRPGAASHVTSLRWSELGTLRRCDVDPAARTVSVSRQLAWVRGGGFAFGPPKSRAGKRMVTIPEVILPVIQWHLACFAQEGDEGLVFTSPAGQPLHHFRRRVWLPALGKARLPAPHFHDLRHTGSTLAASARATLRELVDRMGHDSQRAAMVYLHGSAERQPLTWRFWWTPRARLERATYCLGGTTAPALCRPANTHVAGERNS
jgi:integrase